MKRWPLKSQTRSHVIGVLFFGACGVFPLAVGGLDAKMLLVSSSCLVLATLLLVSLVRTRGTQEIAVDGESITLPGPMWNPAPRRILLTDIARVGHDSMLGRPRNARFTIITHHSGRFGFEASRLSDEAFAEIMDVLSVATDVPRAEIVRR